jgi:hypothetical protein
MAKEKIQKYGYPSVFGSHKSMINASETEKLNSSDLVVLTDEHGDYTTEKNKLDNGLADPNRYKTSRVGKLLAGKKKDDTEDK